MFDSVVRILFCVVFPFPSIQHLLFVTHHPATCRGHGCKKCLCVLSVGGFSSIEKQSCTVSISSECIIFAENIVLLLRILLIINEC